MSKTSYFDETTTVQGNTQMDVIFPYNSTKSSNLAQHYCNSSKVLWCPRSQYMNYKLHNEETEMHSNHLMDSYITLFDDFLNVF